MMPSEYVLSLDKELRKAKKLAAAAESRGCQLEPSGNKGYDKPVSGEAYALGSLRNSGIEISQDIIDDLAVLARFTVKVNINLNPLYVEDDEWN